jgi:O-methyltransferase
MLEIDTEVGRAREHRPLSRGSSDGPQPYQGRPSVGPVPHCAVRARHVSGRLRLGKLACIRMVRAWLAKTGGIAREALGTRLDGVRGRDPLRYADLSPERHALFDRVRPYTQTSRERVTALADAVEYVIRAGVPGDLVECGVWRGGSSMAVALTLLRLGAPDRRLWLYDTFGEMPTPGQHDADYAGREVKGHEVTMLGDTGISLPEVAGAMRSTGYPERYVRCVPGRVEETIPACAPAEIALLRLDTDWYESTRHELVHLYPRLATGGVVLIDDYGHYAGARRAVDEYFATDPILLARIDYTCRVAVKP